MATTPLVPRAQQDIQTGNLLGAEAEQGIVTGNLISAESVVGITTGDLVDSLAIIGLEELGLPFDYQQLETSDGDIFKTSTNNFFLVRV